uniref:ABC transmembrane type-1 domain-containing protein n=1 Tax=Ascaris lumbricoides TaxID=6252 RepID=A0A0M3IK82_ASCLU
MLLDLSAYSSMHDSNSREKVEMRLPRVVAIARTSQQFLIEQTEKMDGFVEGVVDLLNGTSLQNKRCSCTQLHQFELGPYSGYMLMVAALLGGQFMYNSFEITLTLTCILLITNFITTGYLLRKPVIRAYKRIRQAFSEDSATDRLFADTSD